MKIVGDIENSSCIWSCKFQNAIIFAIFARRQKKSDYDTLYKVWVNQMKIGREAEF